MDEKKDIDQLKDNLGLAQQCWHMAHAACRALRRDFSETSPSDITEGIASLRNRWRPDVCPITLLPFFMWIDHPEFGFVPTYGGPLDSYTIPEPELQDAKGKRQHDIEYRRYRFDHDLGQWLDWVEGIDERVISAQKLMDVGVINE